MNHLPLQDIEGLLENTKNSLGGAYDLANQAPALARQLIDVMRENEASLKLREDIALHMSLATINLTHKNDAPILEMIESWIDAIKPNQPKGQTQ